MLNLKLKTRNYRKTLPSTAYSFLYQILGVLMPKRVENI